MNRRLTFAAAAGLSAIILLARAGAAQNSPTLPTLPFALWERYLDSLRLESGIPGLSGAIVKDGKLYWEGGFGLSDVDRSIAAAPDTPYPVGGLTQAFTGVLLGICADRHTLEVDDPIRKWAPLFPDATATVRQVLAHGTEGRFRYDPGLYANLTAVAESCTAKPFRVTMADEIFERLGMAASVPGLDIGTAGNLARDLFDANRLARYGAVLARLAVPYHVDRTGKPIKGDFGFKGLDASTGVVTTVRELARFDIALDAGVPLSLSTLDQMWSQAVFGGAALPTGLGWFVQVVAGERLVWSFGHIPDAGSALIVKLPAKHSTLILLANSPGLVTGANLEQADVTASPFVKIFLRLFL